MYTKQIVDLIERVERDRNNYELASDGYEENPLDDFAKQLDYARVRLEELREHRHEFDEDGFCSCGQDGNA